MFFFYISYLCTFAYCKAWLVWPYLRNCLPGRRKSGFLLGHRHRNRQNTRSTTTIPTTSPPNPTVGLWNINENHENCKFQIECERFSRS